MWIKINSSVIIMFEVLLRTAFLVRKRVLIFWPSRSGLQSPGKSIVYWSPEAVQNGDRIRRTKNRWTHVLKKIFFSCFKHRLTSALGNGGAISLSQSTPVQRYYQTMYACFYQNGDCSEIFQVKKYLIFRYFPSLFWKFCYCLRSWLK